MIFLDANAFYSYYGRKKLNLNSTPVDEKRLSEYLNQQKKKSLPTSVYIEIITHFRNNPKILKELLKFRYEKNMPIYNNIPRYIVTEDELTCLRYMDETALGKYAYKLLKKKIEIESEFTLYFLEITKDLYAEYKLKAIDCFSKTNKKSILRFIAQSTNKDYKKMLEDKIQKELLSGYDENEEKSILKNFYMHELNEACILVNLIINAAIAYIKEQDDIIKYIQIAYKESISNGLDGIKNNEKTMPHIVDILTTDMEFLNGAKLEISEMFEKNGYSKMQRKYMRDVMFTSWFERGKKLDKNDIFDMFCVGCLDKVDMTESEKCILADTSSYVLSFDKKMKSFIGTVKPENLKLIEEIQNK